MVKIVVLLGRPGSGKGTQSHLLHTRLGYSHLSTGDVLRSAVREQTQLGRDAQSYMEKGLLVPDALVVSIVTDWIKFLDTTAPGLVCDGFPRTVTQARCLKNALVELGFPAPQAIELRVDSSCAATRISGRELLTSERSPGMGRVDDKPEVVEARLKVYENETAPVIDFYQSEGLLVSLDASGQVEDIFNRVKAILC